jgi:hypothetical protein
MSKRADTKPWCGHRRPLRQRFQRVARAAYSGKLLSVDDLGPIQHAIRSWLLPRKRGRLVAKERPAGIF